MMQLIKPDLAHLDGFRDALSKGWSPNNLRPEASQEILSAISEDAAAYVATLDDMDGKGAPVTLPDGSKVPRLPGFNRWIWDDGFCGSVGFRWQPGGAELPSYCHGHIGYTVVPWRRGQGYARHALALLLDEVRPLGLPYVELTTEHDNIPSQKVMEANGSVLVGATHKPGRHGDSEMLLYRIALT
ncbi:GNAT family N-acetyltransferase [Qingshengfaniella alkalisoli]|uniref:GNAT family N-acetyltransferase n=1 Tax=Qingshengfaniella alkalisoli TaxID=2599296 RepID=A0A5B8IXA1_9RHOB|nr:GNAT family N-acetyltransferase [Qingshengfaniella alkalisoli]